MTPDGAVNFFGYEMRTVLSDSMEKCDETDVSGFEIKDIPVKSLVFTETVPTGEAAEEWYANLKVGDVLTFKKSNLPRVLPTIPLSRIVLETDAPYMAPVPMRGKRNESSFLGYVVEKMAEVYQIDPKEVRQQTTANACRVFRIDLTD